MTNRPIWLALSCLLVAFEARAQYSVVRIATGLEQPVYVTMAPGDTSRLFIVEANSGGSPDGPTIARIKILELSGAGAGTINPQPFLTIGGIPQQEDQGLFGMAFHPNYQRNGFFYVSYAFGGNGGTSVVERYRVSTDPDVADPASAETILTIFKPFFNHNGNWLGFRPGAFAADRFNLYHTVGDGGSNQDPFDVAQDLSERNGKILRIFVGGLGGADDFPGDPLENYGIPGDNPFIFTPDADPAIWASGLRNPWRASFDRLTGDLYIGNVGANGSDEIELLSGSSSGGENFMWSRFEGTLPGPNPGAATPQDQLPMYECLHGGDLTACPKRSITGGYVYHGPVQELTGQYIFGDFLGDYDFGSQTGSAQLFSIRYDGSDPSTFDGSNIVDDEILNRTADFVPDAGTIDFVSSFGEDLLGNLYIVDTGNLGTPDGLGLGELFKVCGPCEICLPSRPSVPAYCSGPELHLSSFAQLVWAALPGAVAYDVVRGDIATLRATRGAFHESVSLCLEDDGTDNQALDLAVPVPGDAYYLVRALGAAGHGSYESGGSSQQAFRDGEIYGARSTCP